MENIPWNIKPVILNQCSPPGCLPWCVSNYPGRIAIRPCHPFFDHHFISRSYSIDAKNDQLSNANPIQRHWPGYSIYPPVLLSSNAWGLGLSLAVNSID
jgi:hypothetical protein